MIEKEIMEILIVSDTHGKKENLHKLLTSHPAAKYLLFCGDGLSDLDGLADQFPSIIISSVRGNCDWFSDTPEELYFTLEGVRVLMMHGHKYSVKGGVGAALSYAKRLDAHILLYGHTHIPHEENLFFDGRKLTIFNPGSLAERTTEGYSYGVLEIRGGEYLFSHGYLK